MSALEQRDARCQRRAFHRIGIENKSERERKKMRRSLVDTITSPFTSAALSDGPRDDPRRLETVRAPLRQASRLSLCDHIAARIIAVQKRDPRDTRKRDQGDREHALLFAKNRFLLKKESDQKHAPGQSPRPPPRPRRTTWWFKDDNKLTTALPLALARFAKRRGMERPPYNLCGGQNRVQIITSTRETPLFSLGKNTQKNKSLNTTDVKSIVRTSMGVSKKKSIEDEPSPLFFEFLYRRNRSQRRTRWLQVPAKEKRGRAESGSCVLPRHSRVDERFSASYRLKTTKCRNQSKIGSMPERSNMEG